MNRKIPETLENLLQKLSKRDIYLKALNKGAKIYYLTPYKINLITPANILKLYQTLSQKFYNKKKSVNNNWYQNELKIFVWLVVCYCYLKKQHINELELEDWQFFLTIFFIRSVELIQFQAKCLIRVPCRQISWTTQETAILLNTINQKNKLKWHQIALQFFINSNRILFRTAKQCREQWQNHLDPIKVRSEWRVDQDIILLEAIFQIGKKWAEISKLLNNTRTEHMVKNRYYSVIKIYSKEHAQYDEQCLLEFAIQDLKKKRTNKIQKQQQMIDVEQNCQNQEQNLSIKNICLQSHQFGKYFKQPESIQIINAKKGRFKKDQLQQAENNVNQNIDYVGLFLI